MTRSDASTAFANGSPTSDTTGRVAEARRHVRVCLEDGSSSEERYGPLTLLMHGWESIPKYCVTARMQARLRDRGGRLESVRRDFLLNGRSCHLVMHPARLVDLETGKTTEHFPTPYDEVIERMLIRRFLDADRGEFLAPSNRAMKAMVRFRFRELHAELRRYGMERNIAQIQHAIRVLAGTRLEVHLPDGTLYTDTILAGTLTETRSRLTVVTFPLAVAGAIWAAKYTQVSFRIYMTLRRPVSRWLFTQMQLRCDLAPERPFHFSLTAVAALGLVNASRIYDQLKTVRTGVQELVDAGLVESGVDEHPERLGRALTDMRFVLMPTVYMAKHVKASNHRQRQTPAVLRALDNPVLPLKR